ncbi:MAG: phosphodiesterase [Solirubrobacterales bacterium]
MSRPLLLAQLSDLHIGATEEEVDPFARLEAVVGAVLVLPNPVDAVLVSGDLSDDGGEESYRLARAALDRFGCPVHVLPGNHDDRARLRETFGLPGTGDEPINYSAEVGLLRLVLLDSNVPGRDPGRFGPRDLAWLDATLAEEPERPTLLALHHTPLSTGLPGWDAINLDPSEREALGEVVARHSQLRAIAGGHLHRIAAASLAGCPVLSAPSTYLQARPDFDFDDEDVEMVGPPGFALHVFTGGVLSCQVEMLSGA